MAKDRQTLALEKGAELLQTLRKELREYTVELKDRENAIDIQNERENSGAGSFFNTSTLFQQFPAVPYESTVVSQPITLAYANNYVPVSLNYILLSYAYMTQGFLRTVVKEPVDDAFRGGFTFKSAQLDEDDVALLIRTMKRQRSRKEIRKNRGSIGSKVQYNAGNDLQRSDFSAIKHVGYWGRLYGGSGAIINVEQDFRQELDPELIGEDSALEFIPADRWELTLGSVNLFASNNPCPFNYYGYPLNGSRVLKFLWNEAPSYIRLRLQGWGMSEVEHCIRPINAFLKMENLLFELMDEAKVDVFKVFNLAGTVTASKAQQKIMQTMQQVNQIKNYRNALVIDSKDDYMQKQLTFSGLAEMREQGRKDLAAALRFPMNKLFGDSATGFGGGQDALENYNAQVSTFRDHIEPVAMGVAELRCQQLFDFVPEDLVMVWNPLRELSGVEQEEVYTHRSERTLSWFQAGLMNGQEASEQAKKENVLQVDTEVLRGEKDVLPHAQMSDENEKAKIAGQTAAGNKEQGDRSDGAGINEGDNNRENARKLWTHTDPDLQRVRRAKERLAKKEKRLERRIRY